jgi:hypothetical protein
MNILSGSGINVQRVITNTLALIARKKHLFLSCGEFLKVYSKSRNRDGVVHVKAEQIELLSATRIDMRS